jgi:sugar/nucleoside kinase (ribokinase family)
MVAVDTSPNIGFVTEDILQKVFALTDILLPNKRELQILTGTDDIQQGLDALITKIPCIALKLGSKGSMLMIREGFRPIWGSRFTRREHFSAPVVEARPVDTTGAGDSFNAGFISSFLKGESPESWLEEGNLLAGKTIMQKGAVSIYKSNVQEEDDRKRNATL